MKKDWDYYKNNFGTLDDVLNSVDEKDFSLIAKGIESPEAIDETTIRDFGSKYGLATFFTKVHAPLVKKQLDELGFRKFKVFATGSFALLLESTNGQLIRISSADGEDSVVSRDGSRGGVVPLSSAILQPIQTSEVAGLNVAIFPEVRRPKLRELSEESLRALSAKLAEEGFYYEDMMHDSNWQPTHQEGDIQERNVGILEDGTPILLDSDSVIHIRDVRPRDEEIIREQLRKFKSYEHDFTWEELDGTWKQHNDFPQIWNSGMPEAGQLTGVYPRDEVENARKEIGDQPEKDNKEKKEKILDEVAVGYREDAAHRVVKAAQEQGRLAELAERIKGKS